MKEEPEVLINQRNQTEGIKMKRLCILITVTVMLLAAYGTELLASSGTNDKPTALSLSEQVPDISPGIGWSTDMDRYAGSVNFSNDTITGNPEGSLSFGESLKYSQVAHSLGVDESAKASIDLFSARNTTNYLNSIKDTAFSSTINFYADASWHATVNPQGREEDAANEIVGSLIDYASNQWSKQFDVKSGTCTTCATIPGSVNHGWPVKNAGLKASTSWVTTAVSDARNALGYTLNSNQDLVSHLRVLLDSNYGAFPFPDAWDTSSVVYQELHDLDTHATDNVETILKDGWDCYTDPEGCPETLANIQKQFQKTDPKTVFDAMAPIKRQVTYSLIPYEDLPAYTDGETYWVFTDTPGGRNNPQWVSDVWWGDPDSSHIYKGWTDFEQPTKYEDQSISGQLQQNWTPDDGEERVSPPFLVIYKW